MPVEFLSPDQQRRYGRYTDDPSPFSLTVTFILMTAISNA
jgi:hypothetical protein